jgi:hypothetical protein
MYSRLERAKINLENGNAYRAFFDINYLAEHYRTNTDFLSLRAQTFLLLNQPLAAISDLTAAFELKPNSLQLLLQRAQAHELGGYDRNAVADLTTVLGPIGTKPKYAIAGDQQGQLLMQRAIILVRLKRFADAASDMMMAIDQGGRPSILRAQVFLRQNGFGETALDGRISPELREALKACFGLNSCFLGIMRAI